MKKPQQTPVSPQSQESPCDTNAIISELGDIELPNITDNVSTLQNYNGPGLDHNMNWINAAANSLQPPLTSCWPLLSSNLSMNSLLLTALQLRGHQQQHGGSTSTDYSSFIPQGISSEFGNIDIMASSSRVSDSVQQLQTQEQQQYDVDYQTLVKVNPSVTTNYL